jgi:hypothetical protein
MPEGWDYDGKEPLTPDGRFLRLTFPMRKHLPNPGKGSSE